MEEKKTIESVKAIMEETYLGAWGIYRINFRRPKGEIVVYVYPETELGADQLDALKKSASPFKVLILEEDPE